MGDHYQPAGGVQGVSRAEAWLEWGSQEERRVSILGRAHGPASWLAFRRDERGALHTTGQGPSQTQKQQLTANTGDIKLFHILKR